MGQSLAVHRAWRVLRPCQRSIRARADPLGSVRSNWRIAAMRLALRYQACWVCLLRSETPEWVIRWWSGFFAEHACLKPAWSTIIVT